MRSPEANSPSKGSPATLASLGGAAAAVGSPGFAPLPGDAQAQALSLLGAAHEYLGASEDLGALFAPGTSSDYQLPSGEDRVLFELDAFERLPEFFQEEYRADCCCFSGLFPEIHRAWITLDGALYLWNYRNPREFFVYECDDVIVSCALAPALPGVFVDALDRVLVLTTPSSARVLAVDARCGELRLLDPDLCCPTPCVLTRTCALSDGRLLLSGADGSAYALEYAATGGWFRGRCRLRPLEPGGWGWLPKPLRGVPERAPVVDAALCRRVPRGATVFSPEFAMPSSSSSSSSSSMKKTEEDPMLLLLHEDGRLRCLDSEGTELDAIDLWRGAEALCPRLSRLGGERGVLRLFALPRGGACVLTRRGVRLFVRVGGCGSFSSSSSSTSLSSSSSSSTPATSSSSFSLSSTSSSSSSPSPSPSPSSLALGRLRMAHVRLPPHEGLGVAAGWCGASGALFAGSDGFSAATLLPSAGGGFREAFAPLRACAGRLLAVAAAARVEGAPRHPWTPPPALLLMTSVGLHVLRPVGPLEALARRPQDAAPRDAPRLLAAAHAPHRVASEAERAAPRRAARPMALDPSTPSSASSLSSPSSSSLTRAPSAAGSALAGAGSCSLPPAHGEWAQRAFHRLAQGPGLLGGPAAVDAMLLLVCATLRDLWALTPRRWRDLLACPRPADAVPAPGSALDSVSASGSGSSGSSPARDGIDGDGDGDFARSPLAGDAARALRATLQALERQPPYYTAAERGLPRPAGAVAPAALWAALRRLVRATAEVLAATEWLTRLEAFDVVHAEGSPSSSSSGSIAGSGDDWRDQPLAQLCADPSLLAETLAPTLDSALAALAPTRRASATRALRRRAPHVFAEQDRSRWHAESLLVDAWEAEGAERAALVREAVQTLAGIASWLVRRDTLAMKAQSSSAAEATPGTPSSSSSSSSPSSSASTTASTSTPATPTAAALLWRLPAPLLALELLWYRQAAHALRLALALAAAAPGAEARGRYHQTALACLRDGFDAAFEPPFPPDWPPRASPANIEYGAVKNEEEGYPEAAREHLLRTALASSDADFHLGVLFPLLVSLGRTGELLERAGAAAHLQPLLPRFFGTQSAQLAARYWAHVGDDARAARALAERAEAPGLPLRARLALLSQAVLFARGAEGGDLAQEMQELLSVAEIQMRTREELARRVGEGKGGEIKGGDEEGASAALAALDARLLSVSELYNDFAVPFGLSHAALCMLQASGTRDAERVRRHWERAIRREWRERRGDVALMRLWLVGFAAPLYPGFAMPPDSVVRQLEALTREQAPRDPLRGGGGAEFDDEDADPLDAEDDEGDGGNGERRRWWLVRALLAIGMRKVEVLAAYAAAAEAESENGALRAHLLAVAAEVLRELAAELDAEGLRQLQEDTLLRKLAGLAEECPGAGSGIREVHSFFTKFIGWSSF